MRDYRTFTGQALAVAASFMLLSACGGGDDDPTTVTTTTTSTTQPGVTTTTQTAGTTTTTVSSTTTTTAGQVLTNAAQFMISHSFLCMDEGANNVVAQSTCFANVPSQHWRITTAPDNAVTLTNVNSNTCLTIAGASQADLALAVTGPCDGSVATRWIIAQNGGTDPSRVRIVNVNSGKCLEIEANVPTVGKQFSQFTCGGTPQLNQTFAQTVITP